MTAEGALVSILIADAGVSAIAGNRVHPFTDPQSVAFPKITWQRIGTDRSAAGGGFANDGPSGKATARLQMDCWAADLLTAKRLAAAVRRAINGYAGETGNLVIDCIHITDERALPEALYPGQEKPVQRIVLIAAMTFDDTTES